MAELCDRGTTYIPGNRGDHTPNKGPSAFPHDTVDTARGLCAGGRPVIQVQQHQPATLTLHLFDANGETLVIPEDSAFVYRLVAKAQINSTSPAINVIGEPGDKSRGEVDFELTKSNTADPGIFLAQVSVSDDSGHVLQTTDYYLAINPSLVVSGSGRKPITIPEIRLMLRDVCPAQNFLLDDFEFNDSEIVVCILLPISEFNEKYQPKTSYTAVNFPWRFHWLRAACGYLIEMAAVSYARNHLGYTAGGLSVDDKNKQESYLVLAKQLLSDWRTFIKERKLELNISEGYGTLGSDYR